VPSRCGTPRLADPHPVQVMTTWPWAPPPPPSRPHPGIVVSYHIDQAGWECPSASTRDRSDPQRPPRRRVDRGQRLPTFGFDRPSTRPLWVWGVSATGTPPASRRCRQRFLAAAEVTGREQSAAWGSPPPPLSAQASDPNSCQPLTPAAESSYRCPRMVLFENSPLRR
jgi:hypothetical protein